MIFELGIAMKNVIFAFALALSLIFMRPLGADPAIVNFSSGDVQPANTFNFSAQYGGPGGFDLGFVFTVDSPITVTALGFYNDDARTGNNGGLLMDSHDVGLYAFSTGTLLSSTTVLPTDNLVGLFNYHAITPIPLIPGTVYELMSVVGFNDNYTKDPTTIAYDPSITFGYNVEVVGSGGVLQFSTTGETSGITNGWFGPNMLIVGVPEPTLILTLLGMGAVAARCKFRKRS
jgi:hypothetical protein